jgi:hypothetical protein
LHPDFRAHAARARADEGHRARAASIRKFDVAKLEKLLAMRERWESSEARKAFNVAFAAFKAEAIEIIKNRQVTDGPLKNKRYAELFSVVNAVTPALSARPSASWRSARTKRTGSRSPARSATSSGMPRVVSMAGPPDAGGAKNAIQARASTITYLERYTLKAICGVAEQGDDNDGGTGGRMHENAYADHLAAIDNAKDEKSLMKAFGAAWKAGEAINDFNAMRKFGERKETPGRRRSGSSEGLHRHRAGHAGVAPPEGREGERLVLLRRPREGARQDARERTCAAWSPRS